MDKPPGSFDVCIVCALPEEARAVLDILQQQCQNPPEERVSPRYHSSYRFAMLKNDKDELLTLHVSWLPRYGPQEMTLHLSRVLEEFQPRLAIMTGICAGNARQVHLGDLVVAERTFTYDNGKFALDADGRRIHLHDTLTYQLDPNILQFLGLFDGWKPLIARLERPPSPPEIKLEQREVRCYIKAMASGSAVRADHPFEDVQAPVRGTVAIDMEGAAFGLVMSHHPLIRWLVVKGVCDYADRDKSDAYHDYTARASALYALSFIRAYVTNERLPHKTSVTPGSQVGQHFNWGEAPHLDRLYGREHDSTRYTLSMNRQNRQHMLIHVRDLWIKGFLEHSLHNAALIALGLHEQPNALENPWHLMIQETDLPERPLPVGTRITQVYDDAGGKLLILGEPGSGKTTLLLELARNLLDRAEHNESHPMPIVFNLSSWAVRRQPLAEWLVEELNIRYQVPQKLGKWWIDTHQVIPLLDGLDEVAKEHRAACVSAINAYQQKRGEVPLVVCSRTAEYLVQTRKVVLRKAVVIQPLTTQQIDEYLERAPERLAALQSVVHDDPGFRILVQTPLMLNILTLTYHEKMVEDIANRTSIEAQRRQVFADYVQHMFQRRNIAKHFTLEQTRHWLTWLAKQMTQRHQTEFYIERMQLDWLPQNLVFRLCPSVIVGLIYGIWVGLIYVLYFTFSPFTQGPDLLRGVRCGSLIGFLCWLMFVLLNGFVFEILGNSETEKKLGKGVIKQRLITFMGSRVVYGLFFGLLNGFLVGWLIVINKVVRHDLLLGGIISGLGCLVFSAVDFGILGKLDKEIQPAEIVVWSWKGLPPNVLRIFASGLLWGLIYGALLGLLSIGLALRVAFGFAFGLSLVLALVFNSGLSHEMLSEQNIVSPNQGIRNSFRNSLVTGSISGLIGGVVLGLPQVWRLGLFGGLVIGLILGLSVGLNFWFRNGGTACILHVILRVSLWMAHYAPLNYPRFLDFAAEHILLRKVGGSYVFVHRLLLEYFVSVKEPESTESTSSKV